MKQQPLTHQELLEKIRYNKSTGMFYSKQTGLRIGHYDKENGKRAIRIGNKKYQETRLAVFYVTGKWPKGFVKNRSACKTVTKYKDLIFKLPDIYPTKSEFVAAVTDDYHSKENFLKRFWRWLNG